MATTATYGERLAWEPAKPRFHPVRLLVSWLVSAAALLIAAWIVPGVATGGFLGAATAALLIGVLNAILPPIVAALRLPFMALLGFVLVLVVDALMLQLVAKVAPSALTVDDFGDALLAALVAAAVSVVLAVVVGTNDDDTYTLNVVRRVAKRQGGAERTDIPGSDLPRDRRARSPDPPPRDARRERTDDGSLARRRQAPDRRVGA